MFKKGDQKPKNSGRKKGIKNKKTLVLMDRHLLDSNVNLAAKILEEIEKLPSSPEKVELLLKAYRFVDCETKEKPASEVQKEDETKSESNELDNLLSLVKGSN